MRWLDFVSALDEIDWSDPDFPAVQSPRLESLLRDAASAPGLLEERTREIVENDDVYRALAPYMNYPRTLMDKFVLYVDPLDRYRVRMHRFWPRNASGNVVEKVHYHKWHMSTVLLTGSYTERRFVVVDEDEEARTCRVVQESECVFEAGQSNSLPYRTPHQVVNEAADDPCLTLFVRGRTLQPHARIFDTDHGTFYDTFSPDPQIKQGLLRMGRLDGVFHPLLPPRATGSLADSGIR